MRRRNRKYTVESKHTSHLEVAKHFRSIDTPSTYIPLGPLHLTRDYAANIAHAYPLFDETTIYPAKSLIVVAAANNANVYEAVNAYVQSALIAGDGIYWTNQTLSYMCKRVIGRRKMQLILNGQAGVTIVDATAGCGGDVLNFALSPRVKHVFAYERDPTRREMLLNVVKLYGIESRVTIQCEFNTANLTSAENSIIYIDPPFEKVYETPMAIEDCTIEDSVANCVVAGYTVWLHAPSDYQLAFTGAVYLFNKVKVYKLSSEIVYHDVYEVLPDSNSIKIKHVL